MSPAPTSTGSGDDDGPVEADGAAGADAEAAAPPEAGGTLAGDEGVDLEGTPVVVAGDTVTFYSVAAIMVRPYLGQQSSNYLYGDVKNPTGLAPHKQTDRSWLVDAIDDKRRFEELFG